MKCEERTTVRKGKEGTDRETDTVHARDREEAVWPEFNNALVCHARTEFVGQISMEEQGGWRRGRREEGEMCRPNR